MRSHRCTSYPAMPCHDDVQRYNGPSHLHRSAWQQTYYQPVHGGGGLFGLFQPRWRQQAHVPVYGAPVYTSSGYANVGYPAPVLHDVHDLTAPPAYYTTTITVRRQAARVPASTVMTRRVRRREPRPPVYTPTTLDVPERHPPERRHGSRWSTAPAPNTAPLQGTTPAQTATTPTGRARARVRRRQSRRFLRPAPVKFPGATRLANPSK